MAKHQRSRSKKPINKVTTVKQKINYQSYEDTPPAFKVAEQGSSYARLEARVSPELKQRFQQAANIQGRTLTDFMISSLEEIATRTIKQYQIIELSFVDQQAFVNALLHPPEPSVELKRAVKRYKKLGL